MTPEKLSVYDFKYDKEKQELTCANNVKVKGRYAGSIKFEFPLKLAEYSAPKQTCVRLLGSKVATLNENQAAARKAINRQREDREINKRNREKWT